MEVRKMKVTTSTCLNKKISLVRKVLAQLQNLLQIVEKRSHQYQDNWKTIDIIQKTLEDFKASLKIKENKITKYIERIWVGIEETALCLKTLEDTDASDLDKENVKDISLPSYDRFDEIIKDYYKRKSRNWRKLRTKLQDVDKMGEESVKEEQEINGENRWEIFAFNFNSEDESIPKEDPFEDIPVKRMKIEGGSKETILSDLVEPIQQQFQQLSSETDISADIDHQYQDDHHFAKYLESQAIRLKNKMNKHKLKMVLRKPTSPIDSQPKCSEMMSQTLSPPVVLQELSLNNTEELSKSLEPLMCQATVTVTAEESVEFLRPILTNPKDYTGPVCTSFEEMNLKESLMSGINLWGISNPTPTQGVAIPAILQGHDMIVELNSSEGKTTLASIATLNTIKPDLRQPQAVFLLPTEEIAELAMRTLSDLSTLMDIKCVCSGEPEQVESSHVFLATPRKSYDYIFNRKFSTENIRILVVDAADEMLSESQSFIIKVLYSLGGDTQVIILSRKLTPEISCLSQKLRDPIFLNYSNIHDFIRNDTTCLISLPELNGIGIENEVPKPATNNIDFEHMNQFYVIVETDELKIRVLAALAETMEIEQGIIFCNTNQKADWLARKMRENEKGLEVCSVHGGRQNRSIEHLMNLFQAGVCRVLITTDFITLHPNFKVKPVPLVLNYEFPDNFPENYTQRITCVGRTRKGALNELHRNPVFISFVKQENLPLLENLATKFKFTVTHMTNNSS